MANRKYIVGGKVYEETDSRKVVVGGKVLEETTVVAAGGGRIMSSLAAAGGLAGTGGIAGKGGGLAG